jgi:hypothetical protein
LYGKLNGDKIVAAVFNRQAFHFMILAWRLESAATFEDARHSQRHAVAPYEEAAYSSSP